MDMFLRGSESKGEGGWLTPAKRWPPPRRDHGRCGAVTWSLDESEATCFPTPKRSSASWYPSWAAAVRGTAEDGRTAAADAREKDRQLLADLAHWIAQGAAVRPISPNHLLQEAASGVLFVRLANAILNGDAEASCGCDLTAAPLSSAAEANFALLKELLRGEAAPNACYTFSDALAGDLASLVRFALEVLADIAWRKRSMMVPHTLRVTIASSPRWRRRRSSRSRPSRLIDMLKPAILEQSEDRFPATPEKKKKTKKRQEKVTPRMRRKKAMAVAESNPLMKNILSGEVLPIEEAIAAEKRSPGSCWRLI